MSNLQTIANNLSTDLDTAQNRTKEIARNIANILRLWDDNLSPIKIVMNNKNIKFRNRYLNGETRHGVIIGGNEEFLYIIFADKVRPVNITDDTLANAESISLVDFIYSHSDLNKIKAGFDFVLELIVNPFTCFENQENTLDEFLTNLRKDQLNEAFGK